MKRKAVYVSAAWCCGLLICSFLPQKYDLFIIPAALVLLGITRFLFKFSWKEVVTVLISFAVAAGIYRIYDVCEYQKLISYNGKEINFSGKISEIKEYTGEKCTYHLDGVINGRDDAEINIYADLYDCSVNDYVTFKGVVKAYENDYLFDSEDYYKSKGIFLTSNEVSQLEITENKSFSMTKLLADFRGYVTEFINRNLPSEQSSMLCGMLFGDKSQMADDDRTLFYKAGIGHVMAVSGLHLVLFCGLFSFFLDRFKISKLKRFAFLEFIMMLFAVCSGLSISVIRAAVMMTLINSSALFARKADTLNSISIAFILMTAVSPFSIRNLSLILSVTGTFAAGVFAPYLTSGLKEDTFIKRQFKNALYMFFVSLLILPFTVILLGKSSFISPLANIFLTPLCMAALLITIIAVLFIFLEPVFIIKLSGCLCSIVMECVRFTADFQYSEVSFSDSEKYLFALAVVVCIIVFMIFKSKKSLFISISSFTAGIVSFFVMMNFFSGKKLSVAVLGDKGVDVIVVSKGGNTQIIDISGRKKNHSYALKYLQENNISTVERIIIKGSPLQAMSAYNNSFSLIDVENVVLPADTFVRKDTRICGLSPAFSDYSDSDFSMKDITLNIKETRIFIGYGEFQFICDSSCNDSFSSVYAEYGQVFNPPPSKAVIVPEYENTNDFENVITQRNVHIIAKKNGSFQIGGL